MYLVNYRKLFSFLGFNWYLILDVVRVGTTISQYEIDILTNRYVATNGIGVRIGGRSALERYFGKRIKPERYDNAESIDTVIQRMNMFVLRLYDSVTVNPVMMAVCRLRVLVNSGLITTLGKYTFKPKLQSIEQSHTVMPDAVLNKRVSYEDTLIPIAPENYFYYAATDRSTPEHHFDANDIAMEFLMWDWKSLYGIEDTAELTEESYVSAANQIPEGSLKAAGL